MAEKFGQKTSKKRAAEITNTLEWLITAFILAFVFRAFVMEAFRIPTGSMANTLLGNHFRLRCTQCGYKFDYGFIPQKYGLPENVVPSGSVEPTSARCPSCGNYQQVGGSMLVSKGDRILVLKSIYQFFEPKRWDVIVFKNPHNPSINYIKRLIGLPGETIEIIDGDIYINGKIARKPPKVQQELWEIVYDNDYMPARSNRGNFNGHQWQRPFNLANSQWKVSEKSPVMLALDSSTDNVSYLEYDTSLGNTFRATYAYNAPEGYPYRPFVSDIKIEYYLTSQGPAGKAGAVLTKYGTTYRAWVDFSSGRMVIEKLDGNIGTELASEYIEPQGTILKPVKFEFATLDHQLILHYGDSELVYDMGRNPDDAGSYNSNRQPRVAIVGSGRLTLSHIAFYRDIYYTSKKYFNDNSHDGKAVQGNPFTLHEDEFFALGDNSPQSEDSRWWTEPGIGNNDKIYRSGTIPREYLVGKALFVYWPNGFKPFPTAPWSVVPDIGRMRFIYGGTDTK